LIHVYRHDPPSGPNNHSASQFHNLTFCSTGGAHTTIAVLNMEEQTHMKPEECQAGDGKSIVIVLIKD
jgi:hypothetical protein